MQYPHAPAARLTAGTAGPPGPVAVVIVNYNGGAMLGRCLAALALQTRAPSRTIVVDNASTDGSVDDIAMRHPGVVVVRAGSNLGFAAGNNLGIAHADQAEWIALLNPDAYPAPDWLQRFIEGADAAAPDFQFFGCRMQIADAPGLLDGTGDVYHASGLAWRRDHGRPAAGATSEAGEIFSPCAAAALYRRSDLEAVGGFDEAFFCYFEDVDLAFRLRLAGRRCAYVPGAVVDHVGSGVTGRRSDFATYHGQRNLVWTYFKNMPARWLWLNLPQHLLVNLAAVVLCALRGQLGVVLRAKRDALRGLPRILRQRAAVQRAARIGADGLRPVVARGLKAAWMRR